VLVGHSMVEIKDLSYEEIHMLCTRIRGPYAISWLWAPAIYELP